MANDQNGWTRRQFVLSLGAAAIAPDANPTGRHLRHGGFQARFAGGADRLHFKLKEPWMSMEEVRVSGTFLPGRMGALRMAQSPA